MKERKKNTITIAQFRNIKIQLETKDITTREGGKGTYLTGFKVCHYFEHLNTMFFFFLSENSFLLFQAEIKPHDKCRS